MTPMVRKGGARGILKAAVPKPVRRVVWATWTGLEQGQQRVFERRLNVATHGHVYHAEAVAPTNVFYEGCEWIPTRRALRRLRPTRRDVFVDLGAGKGQALLVAAQTRYGRVRGVELMPELVADAEKNIRRAQPRLVCPDVRAERGDVTTWQVPDDVTTVFMYCPFTGDVFHAAMQQVFDSYDRNPRALRIVYDYPWEHNWLMSTGRVVVEGVLPAQWPTRPWWWRTGWVIVTYRVVEPGAGRAGVPRVRRRLFRPRRALVRWGGPNDQAFRLVRGTETFAASKDARDG